MSTPVPAPTRIVVLAKAPVPGLSKTRLQSRWSPQQSAALARAALLDTLDTVSSIGNIRRELVLEGEFDELPSGFVVRRQVSGDLSARIHAAFGGDDVPTLLVGMDTPQLTVDDLERGLSALETHDACLGRAVDGGWWALGLAHPQRDAALVLGIATSTATTGQRQADRLLVAGLRVAPLRELRDVDLPEDAEAVAIMAPHSRFGALLGELATA